MRRRRRVPAGHGRGRTARTAPITDVQTPAYSDLVLYIHIDGWQIFEAGSDLKKYYCLKWCPNLNSGRSAVTHFLQLTSSMLLKRIADSSSIEDGCWGGGAGLT
jgi:hypothetical protein